MARRAWLPTLLVAATLSAGESPPSTDVEEPQPSDLEEHVEVRETGPRDEDPSAFVTELDADEVATRGQDLADILRRVPGTRIRDYGGLGSYATVSIRASTAEQVTVLVDGVPQNRALGGPVDLSSIPATQIETIRVFRGFGPASLGLGGVGGVVDVRTKLAGTTPDWHVDLLGGELQTGRLSAGLSLPTGDRGGFRADAEILTGEGDYVFLDTNGTYPFNSDDDVERRRRNNDLVQSSVLLQQTWEEVGPHRVRVALRLQDRERGVPWVDNLSTETAKTEDRLGDLTASWTRRGRTWLDDTELLVHGFDESHRFTDREGDFGPATDLDIDASGAGLAGVLRASPGIQRVTLRADLREERAEVRNAVLAAGERDRGGAERTLLAVTAEDLVAWGRWMVAPSLRWDRRDDEFVRGGAAGIPPPAADVSESAWSGKLGVTWLAGARTSLRGSAGRFFRSPSLLELFGNRGALRGNPGLRSESGLAAEVGVVHAADRERFDYGLELVGFGRRTEDLIHFRQQSQGIAVAENLLEAEVYGIEGSADLSWRNGLQVDLSATWQRATDRSGAPWDGNPLIYQPEWLAYLGLRWQRQGWRLGWEMAYTGENSTEVHDVAELRLPERLIYDVVAGWDGSRVRLTLDVRNLFDRRVVDVARYPLPDRVVLVHFGLRHRRERS